MIMQYLLRQPHVIQSDSLPGSVYCGMTHALIWIMRLSIIDLDSGPVCAATTCQPPPVLVHSHSYRRNVVDIVADSADDDDVMIRVFLR